MKQIISDEKSPLDDRMTQKTMRQIEIKYQINDRKIEVQNIDEFCKQSINFILIYFILFI